LELAIRFRVTSWRKLAAAVNQCAGKSQTEFVEGELASRP